MKEISEHNRQPQIADDEWEGVFLTNQVLHDLLSVQITFDLLSELHIVSLRSNQVLYEQGDEIEFVYFPINSVVSDLAIMEDGTTVETALVGRAGVVGISAILGSGFSRQWTSVLISGEAVQVRAKTLDKVFVNNEATLKRLLSCYRTLVTQVAQRCVCNTKHTILQRLCCWLLMIHDLVGADNLRLTQEMIASRVGARRAGITLAAGVLQQMRAIDSRRGKVYILDRQVLEEVACECYAQMCS